ncbi:DNA-binding transcriptional regulator CytR [Anaerocolumna cellulosilytica]|uniref:DNA-binding transcriptional regulator CytR n=1 Tax=Anaerocolumna cellulosilytica TaxID=433286 RepID=A0A6S6QYW1_9FIRM|nr:LacI family DNA-binding transcriptional regulator [Anaerocolumna cellulosilytica]MBB5196218.1 LacI family transcriptional regulator [Anaerocolumna cellulosilytica]BCJ92462.1 DNA-binding transcriptional regulator CytR [Anaerocolumna cellulosilytica]
MATIKDIADKLGIAVSTVSKGLNGASDISDQMRQLVLDTAVEMGYASKKMKTTGNRKVCILIENMDYENIDQFGYEIIVGFKLSAARRHWDVSVVPSNLTMQTAEKFDTYMLKNGYSGAFLLGFTLHDDWVKQLNKTSVPTVLLDNYIERNNHVGYVGTDSYEGIDLAVDHLKSLGHTRIAFLNGSKNSMVSEQRYQAFVGSMAKHDLNPLEELIEYGYYVPDCAKYHVPKFLENGATAIICASDLIASGVIAEVMKQGLKIPEDISVVGFDDLPIAAQLTPSLTTIRQDRIDLGKSAFLLLDGLIHNVTISKLLLRAKFIKRQSTGMCKTQ